MKQETSDKIVLYVCGLCLAVIVFSLTVIAGLSLAKWFGLAVF